MAKSTYVREGYIRAYWSDQNPILCTGTCSLPPDPVIVPHFIGRIMTIMADDQM